MDINVDTSDEAEEELKSGCSCCSYPYMPVSLFGTEDCTY